MLLPLIAMASTCGSLCQLLISGVSQFLVGIVYIMLDIHSARLVNGDAAPCPWRAPANANKTSLHSGNHTNTRPRKMLLAWASGKASQHIEDLRKEKEVFGGKLG